MSQNEGEALGQSCTWCDCERDLAPLLVPAMQPESTGLRAQIHQLLPRHSFFRATVCIQQIDSVPFLDGQLAVRWRFKNVHNHRPGLLGIVRTRSRRKDDPDSTPSLVVSTSSDSSANTASPTSFSSNAANASTPALYIHTPSPRTCPSPKPSLTPPATTLQNSPSRGCTPYLDLRDHSVHWNYTLSTLIRLDVDRDTGSILPCPFKLVVMQRIQPEDYPSHPQVHRLGALNLNLSEYVGNGLVDRRYLLRESRTNATLRLTIELEYISGESNYIPPPLPKGEILNGLSNYLSGERSRTRAAHHTIHHGADLYGPYSNQEELELDLFGTTCCSAAAAASAGRKGRDAEEEYEIVDGESDHEYEEDDRDEDQRHATPAFDVERLPLAYGTKTTETLIEAIFNPVRTMEERCESPFTVFVPKVASALGLGLTTNGVSAVVAAPHLNSGSIQRPPSALSDFSALRQPRRFGEVASLYSTESNTTGSSSSGTSNNVGMELSVREEGEEEEKSLKSGRRANSIGSGGRMRGWWKRVASSSSSSSSPGSMMTTMTTMTMAVGEGSRPQTPVARL